MADTRCYKNSTVRGDWRLTDVSERNSVCPGTQQADGFSRCCGKSAICLPNNMCQALNAAPGSTGFYVGSCTDRDYNSPACSNFCSAVRNPDITYNATSGRWQCCRIDADGQTKCDDPTKRSSRAPAPTILLERYSASVATFTASSTTFTSSPSISTPTPSITPDDNPDRLSVGARIGAGLGGAIGGLVLLALIVFLVKRGRRPRPEFREHQTEPQGEYYAISKPKVSSPSPPNPCVHPVELSSQAKPVRSELSASQQGKLSPQELPA